MCLKLEGWTIQGYLFCFPSFHSLSLKCIWETRHSPFFFVFVVNVTLPLLPFYEAEALYLINVLAHRHILVYLIH